MLDLPYYLNHQVKVLGTPDLISQLEKATAPAHPRDHMYKESMISGVCRECGWVSPRVQILKCGHSVREHLLMHLEEAKRTWSPPEPEKKTGLSGWLLGWYDWGSEIWGAVSDGWEALKELLGIFRK
jgi:hypothetical protein